MKNTTDGVEASGVLIRIGNEEKIYNANKEVIVAAGALKTPQLLKVSGIGEQEELNQFNVSFYLRLDT